MKQLKTEHAAEGGDVLCRFCFERVKLECCVSMGRGHDILKQAWEFGISVRFYGNRISC